MKNPKKPESDPADVAGSSQKRQHCARCGYAATARQPWPAYEVGRPCPGCDTVNFPCKLPSGHEGPHIPFVSRCCNFYSDFANCERPAAYVARGADGLEWFVCDDLLHQKGRETGEQVVSLTAIDLWFEEHGLSDDPGAFPFEIAVAEARREREAKAKAAKPIPDHVAAYAAGLNRGMDYTHSWDHIADAVKTCGLGTWEPFDLRAAAKAWAMATLADSDWYDRSLTSWNT